ncbi:hypothetical protein ACQP3J_30650, partial [Escherichia coli]
IMNQLLAGYLDSFGSEEAENRQKVESDCETSRPSLSDPLPPGMFPTPQTFIAFQIALPKQTEG